MVALLVEDDASWQGILSEILNDYGLRVDCTDNLIDATEKLRANPYRLAIVDLSLAGKDHHNQDGLQVLAAIQRFAPGCSSILLTGHASVEIAVTAIQEDSYPGIWCPNLFAKGKFSPS
jgi:DNA-binding NtrC family response regulator